MAGHRGLRIGGIPIHVEWPFFLIAAMLGVRGMSSWGGNRFVYLLVWVGIVFVSVLVHELGHAVAYRLNGQRASVTLTAFWGITQGERELPKWRSILVSLSGPAAAMLVLGLPAILVRPGLLHTYLRSASIGDWQRYLVVDQLAFVNIVWSIANLLPILPLDGGNVADELWGRRAARVLSVAVGLGVAVWLYVTGESYAALFVGILAMMNVGEAMHEGLTWDDIRRGRLRDQGTDRSYRPPGHRPATDRPEPRAPKSGKGRGAGKGRPGKKRGKRPDLTVVPDRPFEAADITDAPRLEAAAWDALRGGDTDEASRVLLEATGRAGVSPYLPASLAASEGRAADAVELYTRAFAAVATPPNLVVARVISKAGLAVPLAERLLAPAGPGPDAASALQNHLHYAECFADAARVGELVAADGRRSVAQSSFEVACSWSRAGDGEAGLRWLVQAVDAGFRAPSLIESESDLALVRAQPGYAGLRDRLQAT